VEATRTMGVAGRKQTRARGKDTRGHCPLKWVCYAAGGGEAKKPSAEGLHTERSGSQKSDMSGDPTGEEKKAYEKRRGENELPSELT